MNDTNYQAQIDDENNFRSTLYKYVGHWKLFILCIITGILLAFLYIRYLAVNNYEIQGKILINNTNNGNGIRDNDNFSNIGLIKTSQSIDDEIGILSSNGIMENVITNNSFNIEYYHEGTIRDIEIYGKNVPIKVIADETSDNLIYDQPIYVKILDSINYELRSVHNKEELVSKHAFGELIDLPYGTFTITSKLDSTNNDNQLPLYFKIKDKDDTTSGYLRNFNVVPANKTGSLLNLTYISTHSEKGEDILTKLIETYIDKTIKYENQLAENTIKMIDNRLNLLVGEIQDVEKSVVDFKTQNTVTDVASNADEYIKQANDYKEKVANYQSQINILTQIEQTLLNTSIKNSIGGGYSINDPSLTNQISKYNEILLERQRLSQSAVTSNPMLVSLDANLVNLRQSILQNVLSAKNGLSIAKGNLQANANRFDAQLARVPAMEKKLLDISRDKGTKEGLYLYLLQKREEEVLSLATPVSSTRIVSYPKAGKFPISPNKKILYLTGLLFGFVVPISLIFIKDSLNNKIVKASDITEVVTAPFLGEISENNDKQDFSTYESSSSSTVELFRLLSFNLDYLKKKENNQTILVTSTVKGEGKTYIASNLAVTMASNGNRVALLAFDLREPQLMSNFDLPNSPGLADFIIKKGMDVSQIIQQHPTIDGLYLIGPGMTNTFVGRLLLNDRNDLLMEVLKKQFDKIIIDTPPIGLISDAFALNKYVDSTIYVVRKDVTKKEHLSKIESIYTNHKLNNTMVLLNHTPETESYGYSNKI
ncbi:GumC family protein [Maribacter forsetii]|uniref:GumC family protein n=1 Tax=Maribacter forsetii TaxID=444515 RepID=UPI00055CF1C0|nr:tyrosine-protein kinase domain-containing protein [Maribacter forsetii]